MDAVFREHLPVIFHVVADLEDAVIFKHGLQKFDRFVEFDLFKIAVMTAEQISLLFFVADGNIGAGADFR